MPDDRYVHDTAWQGVVEFYDEDAVDYAMWAQTDLWASKKDAEEALRALDDHPDAEDQIREVRPVPIYTSTDASKEVDARG